jgi:hypothetical protein
MSGPGGQGVSDQAALDPGLVDRERARWQVGQSGGFGIADLSASRSSFRSER